MADRESRPLQNEKAPLTIEASGAAASNSDALTGGGHRVPAVFGYSFFSMVALFFRSST